YARRDRHRPNGRRRTISRRLPRRKSLSPLLQDSWKPRWARTAVNVEDHMIVPTLDPAAVAADPDRAVEDYVASVYTLPMDRSRPLWEFHFLDFPTSEAASTVVARTVNDVLVGATSAALSRYYFRNSGGTDTYRTWLRSVLLVNTRPTASLQAYANMIESGRSNDVAWGNQLGYILLPFHLAMHNDPLAYVRKAKMTVDRKKSSLEAIFTCKTSEVFVKMFGLKIELCGHPVVFIAPSVYGVPQALIVHYQSYNNTIKIVLSVDEEIFPNYSQLLDDFVESFGLIKDAASRLSESIKKE
uniref:O-acyltransferase WSD1 C-terminal domain-containing protein n=1 Tax=Aegilops tauschii subsp. strangulata TaxID=200361 RepID=A0A453LFE4_AEGTS